AALPEVGAQRNPVQAAGGHGVGARRQQTVGWRRLTRPVINACRQQTVPGRAPSLSRKRPSGQQTAPPARCFQCDRGYAGRMSPAVELVGITKTFPGVRALEDVSLALYPGRVHALVGENGAGKSTLINVLGGGLSPDRGEVRLDGHAVRF